MELSKIAEHPEIRAVHLRNEHERQVFTAASLDLPGTESASAVSMDQDRNNQPGVISVLAFNLIAVFNGRGVKLLKKALYRDSIHDLPQANRKYYWETIGVD